MTATEKNRRYHADHRDAILARQRARYAAKSVTDLARKNLYRQTHREEAKASQKAWYRAKDRRDWVRANNLKYCARRKQWRERNRERLGLLSAQWARNHKAQKRATTARRLADKLRATPQWADLGTIRAFYEEAVRLTNETGVRHEVDHIVPLRSPLVCGLHVACNLQVLTRVENRQKWNRLTAA